MRAVHHGPDVKLSDTGVPFWFEGCAYNVRTAGNLQGDFQFGTATIKGEGVLNADGSVASGGVVVDLDVPQPNTRAVRGKVTMQVTSGASTGATSLELKVKITATENVKGFCPVGEEGTITLTDDDATLRPNGQGGDVILEKWPACPHVHGWTNADNPETEPTKGGRGGGQFADVRLHGTSSGFPEQLGCAQYAAKPEAKLPEAAGTVPFWFEACANNVRTLGNLVGDWQLGTATIKGEGVIAADGSVASGGVVVDLDVPQPNTQLCAAR